MISVSMSTDPCTTNQAAAVVSQTQSISQPFQPSEQTQKPNEDDNKQHITTSSHIPNFVLLELDSVMTEFDFEISHTAEMCLNDVSSDECFQSHCIKKA